MNTTSKPALSFWQIWNMNFGFLGIQFGWGLQMGNMSAIYSYLGAEPDRIAFLWLAAPLTGLIVQPVIGYFSDHTWTRLGRRRPYFLFGAICSSIALIFMPMSSALWMAAGLLWILDSSINISMEPFRAFVADLLPEKQRNKGFAMQSVFIGIGAVLASVLPYFLHTIWKVDQNPDAHPIPFSVRLSFYIGAGVLLAAVLFTIFRTKEYPPDEAALSAMKKKKKGIGIFVKEITTGIFNMPKVMKQLAAVQFLTWTGLYFMWIYFIIAIPVTAFGNPPVGSQEYIKATQWGSLCFGFYSLVTFLFAFLLPKLAKYFSRKMTHMLCLFCGGAGLISVWFIHNPYLLLLSMTGVGIAWASILSMPYAILSSHLPENKMGFYMGVFNFFIVLPELSASLFFGYILSHFMNNNIVLAVVIGGVFLLLAGVLMLRVNDEEAVVKDEEISYAAMMADG